MVVVMITLEIGYIHDVRVYRYLSTLKVFMPVSASSNALVRSLHSNLSSVSLHVANCVIQ